MRSVEIQEARAQFSKLVRLVEQGEEVVLLRGGVPVAKLVPYARAQPRKAGALKGQIVIGPGFDAIPDGLEEYLG